MIKNVVFDLGRVIYTYDPYADLLSQGVKEDAAKHLMERIYDSPIWNEVDRGTYTLSEAVEKWQSQYPEIADDLRRVFPDVSVWTRRVVQIMPDSLEFFYEVKRRGFKVYILTNFGEDTFAAVRDRDKFFDDADGMIVSAHEKLIKPDHAIYHCLLDRYGLKAEETVFFDDLPHNIAGAKEVGIHGIQFTGLEEAKRQFEEVVAAQV